MDSSKQAIIKTLLYSDIFDYPLTKNELRTYLISGKKVSHDEFEKSLAKLSTELMYKNGFYCLKNRSEIIKKRIQRKKISIQKLAAGKKSVAMLSKIPSVLFIGISGGLAVQNADKDDDIDIFIIAQKNKLWLTRLAAIIVLIVLGKYRSRNTKKVANKICLNMLIDETALPLPKSRQNLYSAHEIAQLLPVFNRDNTYEKFIQANIWVKKYLPNTLTSMKYKVLGIEYKKKKRDQKYLILYTLFSILNTGAKWLQLLFIKKHKTTETITDSFLAFHPFDYKNRVLEAYKAGLKRYNISYDKI
ncbi:MAG TPA: hypothetical protein VLF68_03145 [Candidatus Saccharimonadales bacterium]|nr:hypothetical protein [Candidatus Saccharimonadales bacterium]